MERRGRYRRYGAFIIEFAHQQGQDVQGGGITHIHSIYREIGNDYAGAPSS